MQEEKIAKGINFSRYLQIDSTEKELAMKNLIKTIFEGLGKEVIEVDVKSWHYSPTNDYTVSVLFKETEPES